MATVVQTHRHLRALYAQVDPTEHAMRDILQAADDFKTAIDAATDTYRIGQLRERLTLMATVLLKVESYAAERQER